MSISGSRLLTLCAAAAVAVTLQGVAASPADAAWGGGGFHGGGGGWGGGFHGGGGFHVHGR